ncbi:efflux RND transporter periplasmic adaptor subunit [Streptomyces litmocidini]|uniref:Efflux RND transporter periplasmic adaptor subunit n=1 Tax=Streptomyces litmocidini TaxID=67318 RepID=A0ABW7UF92_9ACTN
MSEKSMLETDSGASPRRRGRVATAIAVTAALLSAAGIVAAGFIRSPAQAVADAAPPPPSLLTAQVEYRVLTDSVILRGSVKAEQTIEVTPGGKTEGSPVVTRLPVKPGQVIKAGQMIIEVSGRPVIALRGPLPMYRDLKPGARGSDVAQLQTALDSLGYRTQSDDRGFFGPGTKAAVTALYEDRGYAPLPALVEGDLTPEAAAEEVTTAQWALEDLPKDAPATQRARAGESLRKARARLAEIEATSGPMVPESELTFLGSFPGRVEGVSARVGARVSGSAMVLSAGKLIVNGTLQPHQKGLVQPDRPVEILSETTGTAVSGTVTTVSDVLQNSTQDTIEGGADPAAGERGYPLVVRPNTPLPAQFAGQDVRLTVETASTRKRVLIVPFSAVSAGADGKTSVTVLSSDGSRRRVPVTTGASGNGYVEVRPAAGHRLAEGQKVIVGIQRPAPSDVSND